jgi:hypothetical protein
MGWWVSTTTLCPQRTYKEYHSVTYLVGTGTLPFPLTPASVPLPPEPKGGGHTRVRVRGWGSSNSYDWRESLALCLLCAYVGVNFIPQSGIYDFGYCSTVLDSQTLFMMFEFGGLSFLLGLLGTVVTKVLYGTLCDSLVFSQFCFCFFQCKKHNFA